MSLVCHRENNKVGWSWTQKPVLRPFSFYTMRPFLLFYSRWDLGIMKLKLINYPNETEHKAMGQRQRTEDHWKVIFASVCLFVCLFCCCCCCFAVIHSTCKHALRKESKSCGRFGTLRWSAPKKCQDHFIFVIIVEWISPVRHRVQKRWPKQLTRNQKL